MHANQKVESGEKKAKDCKSLQREAKNLAGGRRLHIMVAIAFGKGVILKHVYEKMDGQCFAKTINNELNLCIAKAGPKNNGNRIIVMDNDPCQNSKVAVNALEKIECKLHKIPARSPDLNPIENVFHIVKKTLNEEALNSKIIRESFDEFKERVLRCLDSIDQDFIDRAIDSLPKRITNIISCKGERLKY